MKFRGNMLKKYLGVILVFMLSLNIMQIGFFTSLKVSAFGENLFTNVGFENATLGTQVVNASAIVTLNTDSANSHTGNNSIFVSQTATGGNAYGGVEFKLPLQSGHAYRLSYWVKAVSATSHTVPAYHRPISGTSVNRHVVSSAAINNTTGWTNVIGNFFFNESGTLNPAIFIYSNGPDKNDIYIDDFEVTEIDAPAIVSSTPSVGNSTVSPIDLSITVNFNKDMDLTTLNTTNIKGTVPTNLVYKVLTDAQSPRTCVIKLNSSMVYLNTSYVFQFDNVKDTGGIAAKGFLNFKTSSAFPSQYTNHITDPGFEDVNQYAETKGGATTSVLGSQVHSGNSAIFVHQTADYGSLYRPIYLQAGKTYYYSAWLKVNDTSSSTATTARLIANVTYKDGATTKTNALGINVDKTAPYTQIKGIHTVPAATDLSQNNTSNTLTTALQIYANPSSGRWDFYVDDVEFVEIPALALTSSTPADAGLSETDTDIVLNFNNEMDVSTLTTSGNIKINGATTLIKQIQTDVVKTCTVQLTGRLAETTPYSVTLTGLKDKYGQLLADKTINFTTKIHRLLSVQSITPANNAVNVPVNTDISLRFNGNMDLSTLTKGNIKVNGGTALIDTIETSESDKTLCTVRLVKPLACDTNYQITLDNLKRDASEEVMVSTSSSFKTVPQYSVSTCKIYKDYGILSQLDITQEKLQSGNISAIVNTITNNSAQAGQFNLIIALYKDNVLNSINVNSINVAPNEVITTPVVSTLSVPALDDGVYTLKAFSWYDFTNITPLAPVTTLNEFKVVTLTVKADGSGDFTSPMLANNSITDNSAQKQYVILIYPGVYTDINWSVKTYTTLKGTDRDTCWLKGELPNDAALTDITNKSTINLYSTASLENLKITAKNLRYPVHSEGSGMNVNSIHNVKNCYIEHLGNEGATAYYVGLGHNMYDVWQYTTAWGYGSASGVKDTYDNSSFISSTRGWYVHNNKDFTTPQINILNYSHMGSTGWKQVVTVESLGSGTADKVILNNCTFDGLFMQQNDSPWISEQAARQYADHSEYDVTLNSCDPIGYKDNHRGRALAIFSNSTSTNSSVSVSGSASDILGSYTSKSGGAGLKGYIYGYWDISGIKVGLSSNIDVANTLGRRLGNCSSTNKELVITFNTTDAKTVTFDKDYTTMTNAEILSEINSAISGSGTAEEYNVTLNEYYPQFTDKELALTNTSTVGIPRFAAVCYGENKNSIRLMTASDTSDKFLGITLERILPGISGRILTEGYMSNIQLNGFVGTIGQNTNVTISSNPGAFELNGAGPAVLSCTNTLGWAYFKGTK
jgi:hypothetical protein